MDIKKLREICGIVSGGTPLRTNAEFWDGGIIPWIKIGDIKGKYVSDADEHITQAGLEGSSAKMLSKGTILYTIFATLGEVGILTIDACTNQAIAGITIRNKDEVLTDYLYYYLKSKKSYVNNLGRGVAQNNINLSILRDLEVPLPTLSVQRQTVDILDKTAKVIKYRQQQLQKLDNLIKARFVEMFGDVIRNSKSWEIRVLADIASSRLGKMLDTKQQTGECSYPYLANFNVQWFRFNTENLNQMDFNEEDRIEFELQNGDLLVCEGGEIGRCAVWHNEIQPCFFQKALHRVRCNRQIVHPDYLGWWFKYNCDHDGFATIAGAKATIAHLPGVKLKQLRVAIPPLELQEQFAAFVNQTDKSKVVVQKALSKNVQYFTI